MTAHADQLDEISPDDLVCTVVFCPPLSFSPKEHAGMWVAHVEVGLEHYSGLVQILHERPVADGTLLLIWTAYLKVYQEEWDRVKGFV